MKEGPSLEAFPKKTPAGRSGLDVGEQIAAPRLNSEDLRSIHEILELIENATYSGIHKGKPVVYEEYPDGSGALTYIYSAGGVRKEPAKIIERDGKKYIEFRREEVYEPSGYAPNTESTVTVVSDSVPLNGRLLGDGPIEPSKLRATLTSNMLEIKEREMARRNLQKEAEERRQRGLVALTKIAGDLGLYLNSAGYYEKSDPSGRQYRVMARLLGDQDPIKVSIEVTDIARNKYFSRFEVLGTERPGKTPNDVGGIIKELQLVDAYPVKLNSILKGKYPDLNLTANYSDTSMTLFSASYNPAFRNFRMDFPRLLGTSGFQDTETFTRNITSAVDEHVRKYKQDLAERRRLESEKYEQERQIAQRANTISSEIELALRRGVETFNKENPNYQVQTLLANRGAQLHFVSKNQIIGSVTFGSGYSPTLGSLPSFIKNSRYIQLGDLERKMMELQKLGGRRVS